MQFLRTLTQAIEQKSFEMRGFSRSGVSQDDKPLLVALFGLAKGLKERNLKAFIALSQICFRMFCIGELLIIHAPQVKHGTQGNKDVLNVDIHPELGHKTGNSAHKKVCLPGISQTFLHNRMGAGREYLHPVPEHPG